MIKSGSKIYAKIGSPALNGSPALTVRVGEPSFFYFIKIHVIVNIAQRDRAIHSCHL